MFDPFTAESNQFEDRGAGGYLATVPFLMTGLLVSR